MVNEKYFALHYYNTHYTTTGMLLRSKEFGYNNSQSHVMFESSSCLSKIVIVFQQFKKKRGLK
jgi:hypothetical protein